MNYELSVAVQAYWRLMYLVAVHSVVEAAVEILLPVEAVRFRRQQS